MSDQDITSLTTPTIPSFNAGVSANSGFNPADVIDSLTRSSHSPQEMQQLAKEASTAIPGGHSQDTPARLQGGQGSFQGAPLQHGPTPVGKGNSKGQGIANAITGVANAIAGVTVAKANEKSLQLATDTHTLLNAQTAMDQAQQVLKTDPNNADAKAAIDHNKQVMNGILSDDKTRKAIAKGFKIDFTDPKANDTPEHKAVQQGQQMAQKSQALSYADQFSKGVPQTMALNQQAIAKYQQAQLDNKSNEATMRAMAPIISSMVRSDATTSAAKIREQGELYKETYKTQASAALNNQKFLQSQALLKTRFTDEIKLAGTKAGLALRNAQAIMDLKDTDPVTMMTKSTQSLSELQRSSGEIQQKMTDIQKEISQESASKGDPKRIQDLSSQLEGLKQQKNDVDHTYNVSKKWWDGMNSLGAKNARSNNTSDSGKSESGNDSDDDGGLKDLEGTDELNSFESYLPKQE